MPNKELIHSLRIDGVQLRAIKEGEPENTDKVVTLTFASENLQDVTNTGYKEVLHIDEESVLTRRSEEGLPFRKEHERGTQFGIVENIRIVVKDGIKMLEGDARFSRSQLGQEMYQDIVDGIRKMVSVGYRFIDGFIDDLGILHISKWLPFEVSITEDPVDDSVGFYRSINENFTNIYNQFKGATMPEENAVQTQTAEVPITQTRSYDDERERTLKITEIGKALNLNPTVIFDSIQNNVSVDNFRSIALDSNNVVKPVSQIGLSGKEQRDYSLFRAVMAAATNDWSKAGLEKEASDAVSQILGKQARSFYVPQDILKNVQRRAIGENIMSTGQHVAGGINTELRGDAFIDVLRDKMVLPQLGAKKLTNLKGLINIPVKTDSSVGTWIEEGADVPVDNFKISQKALSPKTISAYVEYTRQAVNLSNPNLEMLAFDDLANALALPADLAGFSGTGLNYQPKGIINTVGVTGVDGANFDYAKAIDMIAAVEQANALGQNMFWVSNATLKGKLKQTPIVAEYPSFLMKEDNTMCGYQHKVKTGLPDGTLIFGDFSQLVMAEFGVLDIFVNDKISPAGNIRIYGFYMLDFLVRYTNAFIYSDDVTFA